MRQADATHNAMSVESAAGKDDSDCSQNSDTSKTSFTANFLRRSTQVPSRETIGLGMLRPQVTIGIGRSGGSSRCYIAAGDQRRQSGQYEAEHPRRA